MLPAPSSLEHQQERNQRPPDTRALGGAQGTVPRGRNPQGSGPTGSCEGGAYNGDSALATSLATTYHILRTCVAKVARERSTWSVWQGRKPKIGDPLLFLVTIRMGAAKVLRPRPSGDEAHRGSSTEENTSRHGPGPHPGEGSWRPGWEAGGRPVPPCHFGAPALVMGSTIISVGERPDQETHGNFWVPTV